MRFLLRRLLLFALALLGLSLVIFAALRVLPGDVATIMAGLNSPPERVAALRAQLGLDRSLPRQYADWMSGLARGDFGRSMLTGQPIGAQVISRAVITFPLIGLGLGLALLIGVPLGCVSLMAGSPRLRSLSHVLSIVGGSIPALWGGLLLILLLSRGVGLLGILPAQGFPDLGWSDPARAWASLVLPALTLGILVGASLMRYTRSALGELADSGRIDLARACGMTRNEALVRVGLRLVLPQLVSVVGLTFAEMITGAMVVENLFALPGLGSGLVTDLGGRDLIAVQSELFMLAAFFLAMGLLVDLLHRALDPRLKAAPGSGEAGA
ncbi:ABC transporter permease [Bifidobacterium xylocopae]|uniref:ABC transporter permease n=1 Tax=Bifidobacterium xylocopae TaxID=2493119 RepID=A0A366KDW1_9BIFI|nr:ABC transporter permease [Bifidobacterium xylocopae]RBP99900.1 ABC transporter permease [Bifidobacterium xylocopae]